MRAGDLIKGTCSSLVQHPDPLGCHNIPGQSERSLCPLQLLLLPFAFVLKEAWLVVYLTVSWRQAQLGDTASKGGGEGPAVPEYVLQAGTLLGFI